MFVVNKTIGAAPRREGGRHHQTVGTVGIVLSLLCGVHCAALPVVSAALLLLGIPLRQQATWELVLTATNFAVGLIVFLPAASESRSPFPLQAMLVALLFFVSGWQLTFASELLRQSLTLTASILLILAHGQHLCSHRPGLCRLPAGLGNVNPRL
mgnify:CR=1 FL=1|jgi:hypothetical protein